MQPGASVMQLMVCRSCECAAMSSYSFSLSSNTVLWKLPGKWVPVQMCLYLHTESFYIYCTVVYTLTYITYISNLTGAGNESALCSRSTMPTISESLEVSLRRKVLVNINTVQYIRNINSNIKTLYFNQHLQWTLNMIYSWYQLQKVLYCHQHPLQQIYTQYDVLNKCSRGIISLPKVFS